MEQRSHFHQWFKRKSHKYSRSATINQIPRAETARRSESVDITANDGINGINGPLNGPFNEPFNGSARPQTSDNVGSRWHQLGHPTQVQRRRANTTAHSAHDVAAPKSWSTSQDPNAQEPILRLAKVDFNLSDELKNVTLGGDDRLMTESSRIRFSEDVADRNLALARPDGRMPTVGRSVDVLDHNLPGYPRVVVEKSRFSEDVATRNMSISTFSSFSSQSNKSQDLGRVTSQDTNASSHRTFQSGNESTDSFRIEQAHRISLSRNVGSAQNVTAPTLASIPPSGEVGNFADSIDEYGDSKAEDRGGYDNPPLRRKSSSISIEVDDAVNNRSSEVSSLHVNDTMDDALAVKPFTIAGRTQPAPVIPRRATKHQAVPRSPRVGDPSGLGMGEFERGHAIKSQLDAAGINLENTNKTSIYTEYAPAVTREAVQPIVHTIREEQITREIHHHDVFHRILPVREVEVLPAKHFTRTSSGKEREIPAEQVAGGVRDSQKLIRGNVISRSEEISQISPTSTTSPMGALLSDYEERIDADGVRRSHSTWTHPPVLQDGGILADHTTYLDTDKGGSTKFIAS